MHARDSAFIAAVPLARQRHNEARLGRNSHIKTVATAAKPTRAPVPSSGKAVGTKLGAGQKQYLSTETHIVLICGFESFNRRVYTAAAEAVSVSGVTVTVLTDADLMPYIRDSPTKTPIDDILQSASAVLCSLLFDYDLVQWLIPRLPNDSPLFIFESALELMSCNRVGSFSLPSKDSSSNSESSTSIPSSVKIVLQKFGILAKDEDKLAGYLSLLNGASRLLKLVPGDRARDLRHWLVVYSYWNAGGSANVSYMLLYIARDVLSKLPPAEQPTIVQTPNIGLLHPRRTGFFENPAKYIEWYLQTFPKRRNWPRVAVLIYRKHVVSGLQYIPRLVQLLEEQEILPLPIFISGVEAHIIVRDFLTSSDKENARSAGERIFGSFRRGKTANVDAVVSTIG